MGEIDGLLETIVRIILAHKAAKKIMLFGSRARKDNSPRSDIDIAIIDPAWSREDINRVNGELEEEAPTALKIELLGYHLVNKEDLKRRIMEEGIVIHE